MSWDFGCFDYEHGEFFLLASNPSRQVGPDGDTGSQEQRLAPLLHPFHFGLQMLNNRKKLAGKTWPP